MSTTRVVDAVDELVEMRVDALALHRRLRPGGKMHDPRALAERDHAADRRVLRAREDVDPEPHPAELPRELADVDVHAARLLAPQRRERARVHAQHGDP